MNAFLPSAFILSMRAASTGSSGGANGSLSITTSDKASPRTSTPSQKLLVATSSANQCQYCVVAHGAILRVRARNPLLADQVAINYRKADISPRQKAMLDFALKVSTQSHLVDEQDFDVLAQHGFDREDAWDIAAISAFFGLSNRMANVTSMRPNDEFYTLGR